MCQRTLLAVLLSISALSSLPARASGDASGSLGSGGRARGDIARGTGETDRITIDLVEGASLTLRFSAGFQATFVLTDPDGAPVDLGVQTATRVEAADFPVPATGTYTATIASPDGSQGFYALSVRQLWSRKLTISGTGHMRVDVPMAAGGRLAAVVHGDAGQPEISALEDPTGAALLTAPILTSGHAAKLPPTTASAGGVYHLTIDTADPASAWTAVVTRTTPASPATHLKLSNGLAVVSYTNDGVGALLAHRCGRCHGWASSYGGARSYIQHAIGRIVAGSMPPDGPLSRADVALIRAWIATGRAR